MRLVVAQSYSFEYLLKGREETKTCYYTEKKLILLSSTMRSENLPEGKSSSLLQSCSCTAVLEDFVRIPVASEAVQGNS